MSDEERRDSLADQAAAWVPPWERPAAPEPAPDPLATPTPARPDPGGERPPEEPSTISEEPADEPAAAEPGMEHRESDASGISAGRPDAPQPAADGGGGGARRGRRRAPEPPPAPVLDDAELRGALEAILLVVDEPVSELTLAQVLEQSPERIGPVLDDIAAGYTAAGHGFELRRAAGGWRLYTRPEYATYVERFVLDGQSVRLTQAALETLAVVAYKQPVTRSRISAIRGVNCDGVIRTLVSRGLVEECGTEPDSGAFLYRTTTMFLEKLGLNSVDELPPLAPFLPDDVEELADATR
ncbi:SMC-Scp complex subunit ScpB [Micromonospora sp. NBC_01655]|uniref:SMC-Scp complex subunit ScpB n=1 Tax=Micromonospora sp. NBC_01655 TaxID=2975983 RepID=UPI00224EC5AC|nr:SMC-Scp complex subunit ScpB [Micromonospora sp. NBC_01655]MCX4473090.1 SMC-Scp complex subunit ScpB [Micromonospora sp. NBC_01655]